MTRLVAFGCSHTYGQALPDVWDHENNKDIWLESDRDKLISSKYAWPQILANKLNIKCDNNGRPGASNKEIWWNIVNYDFQKTDVVIILWSFPYGRHAIITKKELEYFNINENKTFEGKQKCNIYFKYIYDEHDATLDSYLRINHIEMFLKDNIKLIKHYYPGLVTEYDLFKPSWNKVNILEKFPGPIYDKDRAFDGCHPGPESHKAFAMAVYDEIKDEIC